MRGTVQTALVATALLAACGNDVLEGDVAVCAEVEAAVDDLASIDHADVGSDEVAGTMLQMRLAQVGEELVSIGDEQGLPVSDEVAAQAGVLSVVGAAGDFESAGGSLRAAFDACEEAGVDVDRTTLDALAPSD